MRTADTDSPLKKREWDWITEEVLHNCFWDRVLAGQLFADFVFLFLVTVQVTTAALVFQNNETAARLVFQNNETAAMLVFQTNLLGVELISYVNAFFCSKTFAEMLAT